MFCKALCKYRAKYQLSIINYQLSISLSVQLGFLLLDAFIVDVVIIGG